MTNSYRMPESVANWQRRYELSEYLIVAEHPRRKGGTKAKRLDGRAMASGFSLAMQDEIGAMAGKERDLMRHLTQ